MKKLTFSFFVVLVLLLLSKSNFAQQWSSEQKDVWAGVEKYWEADASGNAQAFLQYFDESYMGWNNVSPVPMNKSNVGKWIEQGTKTSSNVLYTLTPLTIWVKGDFAYVHYYYAQIEKDKETGKNESSAGSWTDILMKKDGKWVLIGDRGGKTSGNKND